MEDWEYQISDSGSSEIIVTSEIISSESVQQEMYKLNIGLAKVRTAYWERSARLLLANVWEDTGMVSTGPITNVEFKQ